jgi:ferredoxin-type protein NapH
MTESMFKFRYLILRRITQTGVLIFFTLAAGNIVNVLSGNFSFALLFEKIPLTDPYATLQMLFAGAKLTVDVLIGAVIVLFFYSLIVGRMFCSWVCPVNMLADFASFLRKKLGINNDKSSQRWSRSIRYWTMGLGLVLSLILGITAFEMISPIGILHRGIIYGMEVGWFVVIALFIFDLLVLKNGFCGHICPLGGFYSLTTRFSLLRVGHVKEKCTLCMLCKDVCPEKQVLHIVGKEDGIISSGECTNCGRCIEVCDDKSLKFTTKFSKNRENRLNKWRV